jgi:hypothetical protein
MVATLPRRHIGLQKMHVGLDLRGQQERNIQDIFPLGEIFADALFFSVRIWHGGSVLDSDIEGQKAKLRYLVCGSFLL